MGIFLDEPKYPVIDKTPGFWKVCGNFNFDDYKILAYTSSGSAIFGYAVAGSQRMRVPSTYVAATIGVMGGFFLAYQQSAGRLMGIFPNHLTKESQ